MKESTVTPNLAAGEAQAYGAIAQDIIAQQQALAGVIARIRESLDIDRIFTTTATEVRQLLEADRVAVFRFNPDLDWEGEFVWEDVVSQWDSVLTAKVYDHCFGEQFAVHYQQGRVQAVADIQDAGLSDCYVEILGKFKVRANLVVPLLQEKQLWGLLCIHQCSGPRHWQASEISFVEQIAVHLGVALQHAQLLAQARQRAQQQQALMGVIARIRKPMDLDSILKIAVTEVRQLIEADRVAVFRFDPDSDWQGEFVSEDVAPEWDSALEAKVHDHCFGEQFAVHYQQGRVQAVADIHDGSLSDCHAEILDRFKVRANLVVPLLKGAQLWGLLCIHQCSGPRHWQASEISFVEQIADHFAVALQQGSYLEQLQTQASQLVKAAARERTLTATVDKIRQSLDINSIFATTTGDVQQLLQADRVAIYRFNQDWSGEFVAESLLEGWKPLLGMQVKDTHFQETQGGRYVRNESYSVSDIYQAGHADCHVKLLEQFEAKAYIIVPILQGEILWGLLAAYQNSGPRNWQADEVDLLAHIGTELGVAIQQAEYLKQVEAQTAQLAKAAERQRTLATTVDKIRQSLDINTIFETTTQEVQRLLEVERVAIYRFYPDWSGEFVADSLVEDWTPAIEKKPAPDRTLLKQGKGVKSPRRETFVPILQGEKIWGLLVASQTKQPRYWQDEDINLLAQVGVQLGVALQQAELLDQTRQQAKELALAIQDLQQTQSQMIQNEKMASLGQLVAGVAHEINNPVSFIYGNLAHVSEYSQDLLSFVQLYHKHYPDPVPEIQELAEAIDLDFMIEDLPKTINSMQMGADRIRQIVLSLRNFSRLDEAEKKPVDIHEGIESTLLILQHKLKANGDEPEIQLIKKYGELPSVPCHAAQLNQVFLNIISNAIDALSSSRTNNPKIMIRTELTTDTVGQSLRQRAIIRIADNGPGMPKDLRSRIFDPFFTTKPVGKGTGLGLSISYKIVVEKHRGKLKCTSKPGEGTEFWIEIPIEQ